MKEPNTISASIRLGRQNPWVPGLEKIFGAMKSWHPEANLFDLLEMKPQMWACHSIGFEWGQLAMLSFSYLETETGRLTTEILVLPHKKSKLPPDEVLRGIGEEIKDKVFQDINDTITEIQEVQSGKMPIKPFSSTFIAIELIREDCDRDSEEEN